MRPPHEMRREMLRLRDAQKMTYSTICERSRLTHSQLISIFSMRATEDTLIKAEAFLNGPKILHRRPLSDTKLSYEMENLSREAWLEYKIKSPRSDFFKEKTKDRQRYIYNAVTFACKQALKKRMADDYQIEIRMSDGQNYWQFKETCLRRLRRETAIRTGDRNAHYFSWPPPIRKAEGVEPRANENGGDAGVVGGGRPTA